MRNTFVFFSTHFVDIEGEVPETFLFSPQRIQKIKSASIQRSIFVLKESPTVFARKALEKPIDRKTVEIDLLDEVSDAWQSLGDDDKKAINKIYLFLHSGELAKTHAVALLPKNKGQYRNIRNELELSEKVEIDIFSFRHGKSIFIDKLLRQNNAKEILSEVNKQVDRYKELTAPMPKSERQYIFREIQEQLSIEAGISKEQIFHWEEADENKRLPKPPRGTRIVIAYIPADTLVEPEEFLGKLKVITHPDATANENISLPVLCYGKYDLFPKAGPVSEKIRSYLNPRYRYLDSSIWLRYVALDFLYKSENRFKRTIAQVADTLKTGVHNTVVAREYQEFSQRLFKESYLEEDVSGGHASAITPFAFHSETLMSESAEEYSQEIEEHAIKWDLLLVDDYANAPLRSVSAVFEGRTPNKKELIKNLLGAIVNRLNIATTLERAKEIITNLRTDHPKEGTTSQEATETIQKTKADRSNEFGTSSKTGETSFHGQKNLPPVCDLIFLDYLFSKDQEDGPRYGTELLEKISKGEIGYGKAANFKYWVFPVSVFAEAFASELQEKGIQHQETHWVLARGADPVNTPQLFRAAALEFMKLQYDGLSPDFEEILKLWLQYPIEELEGKAVDPRKWARSFNTVLAHHFGKSDTLTYNSAFVKTARKTFKLDLSEATELSRARQILELLKRLIYNLGFSSIFDHEVNAAIYKQLYAYCEEAIKDSSLDESKEKDFRKELRKLGEGIYAIHNTYEM